MSTSKYPPDCSSYMTNDRPVDRHFQIPGGTLQYNAQRDGHFPYIYKIETHSLVHTPKYVKTILIHVVDTAIGARVSRAKFEKTLSVPLGPNVVMDDYGPFPNLISFLLFNKTSLTQVYWNWNWAQYCLPGRLPTMVYILKRMT
jgi:hypothetical protein